MPLGSRELRQIIYESSLDASFGRRGACIALVKRTNYQAALKMIAEDDLISKSSSIKTKLMNQVVNGKKFQDLDRRLRLEMLSMDGATVLDNDGRIFACGAIVKVSGGSLGGGRKAAAIALSEHGFGIKVSSDGPVTGYMNGDEAFKF